MHAMHALALRFQEGDEGLSFRDFLSSVPTDPAAVFVLILVVGAVAVIIYSGRSGRGGGTRLPPS